MYIDKEGKGLLPCKFCGAGLTQIRRIHKDSEDTAVDHWCEGQKTTIQCLANDIPSAIAAWNIVQSTVVKYQR